MIGSSSPLNLGFCVNSSKGLEFGAGQEVAVPQHAEQHPLAELVHVRSTVQVEETSVLQSCCHSGAHFQEGLIHLFGVSVIHVNPGLVIAVVTAAYKENSLPGLWVMEGGIHLLHCRGWTEAGYGFRIPGHEGIAAERPHAVTCP